MEMTKTCKILIFHPVLLLFTKTPVHLLFLPVSYRGPPHGFQWGPAFARAGTAPHTTAHPLVALFRQVNSIASILSQ